MHTVALRKIVSRADGHPAQRRGENIPGLILKDREGPYGRGELVCCAYLFRV